MLKITLNRDAMLLFNPYSGAIGLINTGWYWNNFEKATYFLIDNNFILLEDQKRGYLLRQKNYLVNYKKKRGLHVYVSPTFSCPMGCSYCFQKSAKDCMGKLEIEDIPNIMKTIKEQMKKKNLNEATIVLFGGEPLLPESYDFNKSLMQSAKKENFKIRVVTSGSTVNDEYITLLKKYSDVVADIDVTIDGPPEIHDKLRPLGKKGSFNTIAKNIDKFLANDLPITAKTNVGQSNIDHLEGILRIYEEKGWTEKENFKIAFNFVRDYANVDDAGETLNNNIITKVYKIVKNSGRKIRIDSVKELGYLAHCFLDQNLFEGTPRVNFCNPDTSTTLSISPNGDVFPCNWMVGDKKHSIGTLEKGFTVEKKKDTASTKCKDCDIFSLCGGGCMIDRHEDGYYQSCRDNIIKKIKDFMAQIIKNYPVENYRIIRKEFDF